MIERYSDKKIRNIWSERYRLRCFQKIEAFIVKYYEEKGLCKKGTHQEILNVNIKPKEVQERERITKHDLLAFVEILEEKTGAQMIHAGVTSSDILDTATGLQIKRTTTYIKKLINELSDVMKNKAIEHKDVIINGRTHNVIAEPTTVGLKLLNWYIEVKRSGEELIKALRSAEAGKISGAVGTYSTIEPEMETQVLNELKLKKAKASNQVIQRDIYARLTCEAAIFCSVLDRIATQIRLLSHTEIGEIMEPFSKGQKGSSAMPHKKNPVRSERISGLARLIRGYAFTGMENINLWHERDISHSSAERIFMPDCFHITAFLIKETTHILGNLNINRDNINRNLKNANERFYSGVVLTELIRSGLSRKKSYELIQKIVFESIEKNKKFSEVLFKNDSIVKQISKEKLKKIFNIEYFKRHTDVIFNDCLED